MASIEIWIPRHNAHKPHLLEFGDSAASIRVQLLIKCDLCTATTLWYKLSSDKNRTTKVKICTQAAAFVHNLTVCSGKELCGNEKK